jgi:hypothetical protein
MNSRFWKMMAGASSRSRPSAYQQQPEDNAQTQVRTHG